MARELLISCDRCRFERDERSEGAPRTVGVDGKDFVLDLCETCDEEMLGAVRRLVQEYGMPAESVTPAPTAAPTRTSKDTAKGPVSRKKGERTPGVVVQTGTHRGSRYLGPQQAAATYPTTCPWCPHKDKLWNAGDVGEHLRSYHGFDSTYAAWGYDCPVCGKEGYSRLANHVLMAHKMDMCDGVRAGLAQEPDQPARVVADVILERVDPTTLRAVKEKVAT